MLVAQFEVLAPNWKDGRQLRRNSAQKVSQHLHQLSLHCSILIIVIVINHHDCRHQVILILVMIIAV